jgi:hypothetical protein
VWWLLVPSEFALDLAVSSASQAELATISNKNSCAVELGRQAGDGLTFGSSEAMEYTARGGAELNDNAISTGRVEHRDGAAVSEAMDAAGVSSAVSPELRA